MSRIEQALEKAIKIRESAAVPISGLDSHRESAKKLSPLPAFISRNPSSIQSW